MKIAILGAGAMGCFYAAKLSQKYDVLLVGRDEKKIKKIRKDGISVTGLSRLKSNKKNLHAVTSIKFFPPVDLLIVLVKTHQTEEAVRQHRHLIGKETVILTLQNGLGNVEAIKQAIGYREMGEGMVLAGTTAHGVTLIEPGLVRHAGKGDTVIGYREQGTRYREDRAGNRKQGAGEEKAQRHKGTKAHSPLTAERENDELLHNACCLMAENIAEIFSSCGIVTKLTNDIESVLWGKLVLNCAINPVAALLHIKNGVIPKNQHSFFLAKSALLEAAAVAKKKKLALPYKNPVKRLREVCKATSENVNSMLQDAMNKKRTEIDTINGAVVREAEKLRMGAPVNKALTLLIKAVERSYLDNKQ